MNMGVRKGLGSSDILTKMYEEIHTQTRAIIIQVSIAI